MHQTMQHLHRCWLKQFIFSKYNMFDNDFPNLSFQRSSDDGEEKIPQRYDCDADLTVFRLLSVMPWSTDERFSLGDTGFTHFGYCCSNMRTIPAHRHSLFGFNMCAGIEWNPANVCRVRILDWKFSEYFVATESHCGTTFGGIHVSGLHDAVVVAVVQPENGHILDATVLRCGPFASQYRTRSFGNGRENCHISIKWVYCRHSTSTIDRFQWLFLFFVLPGFQFAYTGIFGIYSAFLFARSGHFIAPFIAHAFCNHMGFPDIQDVVGQTLCKKITIVTFYVIGLIGWIYLLPIATEPILYDNSLYWTSNTNTTWTHTQQTLLADRLAI